MTAPKQPDLITSWEDFKVRYLQTKEETEDEAMDRDMRELTPSECGAKWGRQIMERLKHIFQ